MISLVFTWRVSSISDFPMKSSKSFEEKLRIVFFIFSVFTKRTQGREDWGYHRPLSSPLSPSRKSLCSSCLVLLIYFNWINLIDSSFDFWLFWLAQWNGMGQLFWQKRPKSNQNELGNTVSYDQIVAASLMMKATWQIQWSLESWMISLISKSSFGFFWRKMSISLKNKRFLSLPSFFWKMADSNKLPSWFYSLDFLKTEKPWKISTSSIKPGALHQHPTFPNLFEWGFLLFLLSFLSFHVLSCHVISFFIFFGLCADRWSFNLTSLVFNTWEWLHLAFNCLRVILNQN